MKVERGTTLILELEVIGNLPIPIWSGWHFCGVIFNYSYLYYVRSFMVLPGRISRRIFFTLLHIIIILWRLMLMQNVDWFRYDVWMSILVTRCGDDVKILVVVCWMWRSVVHDTFTGWLANISVLTFYSPQPSATIPPPFQSLKTHIPVL